MRHPEMKFKKVSEIDKDTELVGALGVGGHGRHLRCEYRAAGPNLISDHADGTAPPRDRPRLPARISRRACP